MIESIVGSDVYFLCLAVLVPVALGIAVYLESRPVPDETEDSIERWKSIRKSDDHE